jgi:pyruvate-ferredoxin/flavodoxin oxidoreductase
MSRRARWRRRRLSIFGDHSDVMACRATGYAMLCSASVQEVMDFALIARRRRWSRRVPFLHFFDGFRTSHEVTKIEQAVARDIRAMIDEDLVTAHRERAMNPDPGHPRHLAEPGRLLPGPRDGQPLLRRLPGHRAGSRWTSFAELTGASTGCSSTSAPRRRARHPAHGLRHRRRQETVEHWLPSGEKVGMIKVRLFRPFASARPVRGAAGHRHPDLGRARPHQGARRRRRAHVQGRGHAWPRRSPTATWPADAARVGGRYGLSSKEFTPAMVKAVFDELAKDSRRITSPSASSTTSATPQPALGPELQARCRRRRHRVRVLRPGLRRHRLANKNSIKIIGEETPNFGQGYFEYDSKKAGAMTISHLRFGPKPINSTYLIGDNEASFVACHQPTFLTRYDMLAKAKPAPPSCSTRRPRRTRSGTTCRGRCSSRSSTRGSSSTWSTPTRSPAKTGMGRRINTIMQTCFFAISGILPRTRPSRRSRPRSRRPTARRARSLLERNYAAIDATLAACTR